MSTAKRLRSLSLTTQPPPTAPKPCQPSITAQPPPTAPKPRSLSQSGQPQPLSTAKRLRSLSLTTQPPPTAPKPRRLSITAQPPPTAPKPHRPSITKKPPPTAPKPHRPSITKKPPPISPKPSQSQDLASEYITMKEMLADLVDLLAGNAPVISQLNNHFFSSDLIPKAVHVTVETTGLTPYDRSNKIFSSVLATLECHPNPNSVFSSLVTALQKVGLNNMASKLMEILSKIVI